MRPSVFDSLLPYLAPYRIVAPPLPGYDGIPCEPYTLTELTRRIARNAPERCVVAGWSLGGLVALRWALAAPRQIERMVLIGTTPCFVQRPEWRNAVEADVLSAFAALLAQDSAATLERFALLQARGDTAARGVARALMDAVEPGGAAAATLADGLKILAQTDLRPDLAAIDQEVLVVSGDSDALIPVSAAEYLAASVPRGRLELVHGAGHAPFVSFPEKVGRSMLEFFDER
jgi:pimeloyl-[acyl-carrier protein] methyl ester esterase